MKKANKKVSVFMFFFSERFNKKIMLSALKLI